LSTLLADPERGNRMGRNGVELARSRYGWTAIGRQLEDIYRQIGERRRA